MAAQKTTTRNPATHREFIRTPQEPILFAALDRLAAFDVEAYERAFKHLSKGQQERYLLS